jgi:DNA-directed RNA polymerase specialized sigma subunit
MKKINKNLSREQLRVKMCKLQDEAQMYRREIDRIDKKNDKEKYEKLLNRCFFKNNYEYFRIEGYDEYYQLYGTNVDDFSKDEEGNYSIKLKEHIWEDSIENSVEITNEEFENKLKEAISNIKI